MGGEGQEEEMEKMYKLKNGFGRNVALRSVLSMLLLSQGYLDIMIKGNGLSVKLLRSSRSFQD